MGEGLSREQVAPSRAYPRGVFVRLAKASRAPNANPRRAYRASPSRRSALRSPRRWRLEFPWFLDQFGQTFPEASRRGVISAITACSLQRQRIALGAQPRQIRVGQIVRFQFGVDVPERDARRIEPLARRLLGAGPASASANADATSNRRTTRSEDHGTPRRDRFEGDAAHRIRPWPTCDRATARSLETDPPWDGKGAASGPRFVKGSLQFEEIW